MQLKKILLPVDGSEHSNRAATYAIEMAQMAGAEILLLYCRKTVPSYLGVPNVQDMLDKLSDEAENLLDAYRRQLAEANVSFTDRIIGGNPAEVISDVVLAESCDMVIMGSRGRSELEGLLLGSVTHKILQVVTRPVLVIH